MLETPQSPRTSDQDPAATRSTGRSRVRLPARVRRFAWGVLIGLALVAVIVGQVLETCGDGRPSLPGVLFDPVAALALLALCADLGVVLAGRWILESDLGPGLWLGTCTALGAAILSLAFLALGLLHLLQPLAIGGLLVVCLIAAGRASPRTGRAARDSLFDVVHQASSLDLRLLPALCGLILLPFALYALLPPGDWDSLMYHLDIPAEWLAASGITLPVDNYHFVYVGLLQTLYLPLLGLGALAAPAVLNLCFAVLLGLGVFDLASRHINGRTALLASIAMMSSTSVLLVASTGRVDATLAFMLVLACAALEKSIESPSRWKWTVLAGLLLGCAVGVKWSALAFLPGLLLGYAWSRWRSKGRFWHIVLQVAGICVLIGLLALPWLLKNARFVGPPLYPMGSTRMMEPWIAQAYGGPAIPRQVDPSAFGQLGQARQRFNLVDFFLHPEKLTIEGEGRWYFPSLLLLGLPALLLLRRQPTVLRLVFTSALFCALALGLRSAMNLRYLIPALPGFAVGAGYVLSELGERLHPPPFRRRTLMTLVLLCLAPTLFAGVSRLESPRAMLLYLLGTESSEDYLTGNDSPLGDFGAMLGRINSRLPAEARVLMLFEARDLYIRPETLQDNRLANWPLLAAHLAGDPCLSRTGVTHVLLNESALEYYIARGLNPSVMDWEAFERFRADCLREVDRTPSHILYEVRPEGG